MEIYNALPEGNEMASLEPARYFNLAIEQVEQITECMKDAKGSTQPLLIHLDVLLLSERYPSIAEDRIYKLDLERIRIIFLAWFDRNGAKISSKFREEIEQSGINIIGTSHSARTKKRNKNNTIRVILSLSTHLSIIIESSIKKRDKKNITAKH